MARVGLNLTIIVVEPDCILPVSSRSWDLRGQSKECELLFYIGAKR